MQNSLFFGVTLTSTYFSNYAVPYQGQVVATAEATVSQLDAEISEDQQAVRQLQQNVADSLAQIRAVDGSSGRSGVE